MPDSVSLPADTSADSLTTLKTPGTGVDAFAELRHDLRNPIGHILGYAEILIEDAEDSNAGAAADLEKIRAASKTLLALIDERLRPDYLAPNHPGSVSDPAPRPSAPAPLAVTPYPAPTVGDVTPRMGRQATEEAIVLVVDDVEENRTVLARRLQRQGHQVVTAASGMEALSLLAGQGFDLVLLDIMMPGMDGYEVLQRIKSDPKLKFTPVVVVSALDEVESVARCIEMGAEDYLTKPFNPTLLKARVTASLRAKQAHDREVRLTEQLKTNYDKLLQAEKLRDDLTGMIVHDLRTPLTSVLSGLQTIDALGDLDEIQQEMLAISTDGAETLLGLINDLLDISKLEDGSLNLEYGDVKPQELAERANKQVALLARSKGLNLAIEVAPNTPDFRGDEDKLRRTLINLMGNALKFTPSGGTVTVGAQREGTEIQFSVRDTGEGIPKEAFGRIFEKFGQVEDRKAGRKMSTGLGLTFCKMAVEAHGGRIWVESELGVGSTFFFAVPIVPPSQ